VVKKAIFLQRKVENRVFARFNELAADRHPKAPEFADQLRGWVTDFGNQYERRVVSDGSRLHEPHRLMSTQSLNNQPIASLGDGINCDAKLLEELGAAIAHGTLDGMLSSASCADQESHEAIPAGRESHVAVRALDY